MAAPKKRGRQAALEQLAEKSTGGAASSGLGGAGVLSPTIGGGVSGPTPSFGGGAGAGPSSGGVSGGAERMTFAERVGDVKQNVERARAEYRSRAAGALGAPPSAGPSVVVAGLHQRFSDLEAAWGEVMDYTKIDPFSTSTPGLNAASAALSRNRHGLDQQVNAIIDDLWDGVSSGQARTMTDARKDDVMQSILSAPGMGGMPLSPQRQGYAPQSPGLRGPSSPGPGLALQLPDPARMGQQGPPQWSQDQLGVQPPPAGAQDYETRRQLEIMRQDIMRLEEQVMQAVEAEEQDLPPPPPLIQKNPAGIANMNKAAAYEDIVYRIKTSVVGAEPDVGGTPCNSIDDPNVPLMMPPRGGMKIRQQIDALIKETQELKEATVQEIGGEAAARRMQQMQADVKKQREKRTR